MLAAAVSVASYITGIAAKLLHWPKGFNLQPIMLALTLAIEVKFDAYL